MASLSGTSTEDRGQRAAGCKSEFTPSPVDVSLGQAGAARWRRTWPPAFLFLVLGLVACSSASETHDERCDAKSFANTCTDFKGVPDGSSYANACSAISLNGRTALYSDNASCDLADVEGGCQTIKADGTKATVWSYKSTVLPDAKSVQATCANGTTFVTP
jgi:hypothetical protein